LHVEWRLQDKIFPKSLSDHKLTNLHLLIATLLLLSAGNSCIAADSVFGDNRDFWERMRESDQAHEGERRRKELREKEMDLSDEQELKAERQRVQPSISDDSDDDSDRNRMDDSDKKFGSAPISVANTSKSSARVVLQGSVKARPHPRFDDDLSDARPGDHKKEMSSPSDHDRDDPDKLEWARLIKPQDLIGDWVPSKPDPTDNGGFTHAHDNGKPVPYTLNGHPDLQRKVPWATDD
jgi:hypothetical protein